MAEILVIPCMASETEVVKGRDPLSACDPTCPLYQKALRAGETRGGHVPSGVKVAESFVESLGPGELWNCMNAA